MRAGPTTRGSCGARVPPSGSLGNAESGMFDDVFADDVFADDDFVDDFADGFVVDGAGLAAVGEGEATSLAASGVLADAAAIDA